MSDGILGGLRVLDFSRVLAGPYATRVLADFGAEVIKVQSRKVSTGAESNDGGYFNTWNSNKRSIMLDMDFHEAKEIILRLTSITDVLIENFSPRVMANWGLNYSRLKKVRPDLIMASMSGMGQAGPWKDFAAFGPTVQSFGGLTYLTSYGQDSPVGPGYSYADPVAGLYCALAVLAALAYRDETGKGQYIDLSEYEAVCSLIGPAILDLSGNQRQAVPTGNRQDCLPAAPCGCYRCLGDDRWCVIAVFNDEEWQSLCQVVDRSEWSDNERFATLSNRKKYAKELDKSLEKWTSGHTPEKVVQLLQNAGVPAGVVQNAEDLANDPHLLEREFFIHLEHSVLGDTISDRSPIRFSTRSPEDWKAAPRLGEANQYVFVELLGFTETELSEFMERGIIG